MKPKESLSVLKKEILARNYTTATVKNYVNCVRLFLAFVREHPKMATNEYIRDFMLRLKFKKYTVGTINLFVAAIKFYFKSVAKKLKPCPFCGDEEIRVIRKGTPAASCIVGCTNCGTSLESNEIGSGYYWNARA